MICPKCNKEMRKGYLSAVKTAHSALQLKVLLKLHRLRRATERKWKHAYVRIAG